MKNYILCGVKIALLIFLLGSCGAYENDAIVMAEFVIRCLICFAGIAFLPKVFIESN